MDFISVVFSYIYVVVPSEFLKTLINMALALLYNNIQHRYGEGIEVALLLTNVIKAMLLILLFLVIDILRPMPIKLLFMPFYLSQLPIKTSSLCRKVGYFS